MARRFTAANAADLITFALTAQLAAIPTGALTFGVLWRPQSNHRGGIVKLTQTGAVQAGCNPFDGAGHLFFSVNGSGDAGAYTGDIGNYRQDWFTKPAGNGVQLRHHLNRYAAPGWAHNNLGAVNAGGAANENMITGLFAAGQWLDADIAAMGWYAANVADGTFDASALMAAFDAWRTLATPAGLWAFNQVNAADPIPDESGNGATGTPTGTTISSDPPGFSFASDVQSEGRGFVGVAGFSASSKTVESEGHGTAGVTGGGESAQVAPSTALNFFNVVSAIGQCASDGLAIDSIAGRPCRECFVVAGSIVADSCGCTCGPGDTRTGQLALSVTRIFPSATFPNPAVDDGRQSRCGVPFLVAEVHVQVHRCVHTMDENGTPPTCDQLLEDARIWHSDAAAVRKAVGCCVRDMKADRTIRDFAIGETVPLGEEGGCTGSDLRVLVAIANCTCPRG
jgi:hypothetical protein